MRVKKGEKQSNKKQSNKKQEAKRLVGSGGLKGLEKERIRYESERGNLRFLRKPKVNPGGAKDTP